MTEGKLSARPRLRAIPFLAFTAGALLLSLLATSTRGWGAPCLFHAITGLPCPSCGMTRAFLALGHGHWRDALALNLASPGVYLAAWTLLALSLLQILSGKECLLPAWQRVKGSIFPLVLVLMALAWGTNLWRQLAGS